MAFTYFFRDFQTLQCVVDVMVPAVIGRSKIKIWDAGCASGQEPYTFAILLAEKMGKYIFKNVEIHATDIDISNQFDKIISRGAYPYLEIQRVPEPLLKKYFRPLNDENNNYEIINLLREKIIFKREDLNTYIPTSTGFSLVICKNVLLHQNQEQRLKIFEMFYNALSSDGFLVMEQTQKLPDEFLDRFNLIAPNAQLYQKKQV